MSIHPVLEKNEISDLMVTRADTHASFFALITRDLRPDQCYIPALIASFGPAKSTDSAKKSLSSRSALEKSA